MARKKRVIEVKKNSKKDSNKFSLNEFIYGNFRLALKSLGQIKRYVLFSLILFLISGIIGYIFPQLFEKQVLELIKQLVEQTKGLSGIELIKFIIYNNVKSAFIGLIFGVFFALVPVGILLVNGYVIGFVANKAVQFESIFVLWRLFPHGIFEIPAIMISIGIGIKIALFPFYIKEKAKGFFSLLIISVMFSVLSMVSLIIIILFTQPQILMASNTVLGGNNYNIISRSSLSSFAFFILMALSYVLSIVIGLKILSEKDREIVKGIFADSFRTFVFVVIPLLVIAGIIEGGLIWLMG